MDDILVYSMSDDGSYTLRMFEKPPRPRPQPAWLVNGQDQTWTHEPKRTVSMRWMQAEALTAKINAAAPGHYPVKSHDILALCDACDWSCQLCGRHDRRLTVEHVYIVGEDRRGRHSASNVRLVCGHCLRTGDRWQPHRWLRPPGPLEPLALLAA